MTSLVSTPKDLAVDGYCRLCHSAPPNYEPAFLSAEDSWAKLVASTSVRDLCVRTVRLTHCNSDHPWQLHSLVLLAVLGPVHVSRQALTLLTLNTSMSLQCSGEPWSKALTRPPIFLWFCHWYCSFLCTIMLLKRLLFTDSRDDCFLVVETSLNEGQVELRAFIFRRYLPRFTHTHGSVIPWNTLNFILYIYT